MEHGNMPIGFEGILNNTKNAPIGFEGFEQMDMEKKEKVLPAYPLSKSNRNRK